MPELTTATNNLFRFPFCLITLICACIINKFKAVNCVSSNNNNY